MRSEKIAKMDEKQHRTAEMFASGKRSSM